jgi:hypothetical protein
MLFKINDFLNCFLTIIEKIFLIFIININIAINAEK